MKKILAVLLACSMLFAFAACGGNNEETTTTAAPETTVAEETTAADVTEAPAADETTAPAADETTAAADETTTEAAAPAGEMAKADFVAFLNAETAKAAKGSYNYNRVCDYTDPIDVGGATGIINGIIQLVDKNSNLDTVVGGFLGIGTKKGAFPKEKPDSDYQLKATKLTEADLGSFSYADGVYSFTLANATNPKKTNATPISRFTNDFITHEEVSKGITDGVGDKIVLQESTVNYTNIKVKVTVADGKITKIEYSYDFDAALTLKAGIKINGDGAAKTTGEFTNIAY